MIMHPAIDPNTISIISPVEYLDFSDSLDLNFAATSTENARCILIDEFYLELGFPVLGQLSQSGELLQLVSVRCLFQRERWRGKFGILCPPSKSL